VESRILVIDDDSLFREGMSIVLRSHGYEVHAAGSLADADRLLSERPFDLALLDIHIPGNERLEWLRERSARSPDLAIILCTGYPALDTAIDAVGLSAYGYLVKPVRDDELVAQVERVLAKRRAQLASPDSATVFRAGVEAARERYQLTTRQFEVLELVAAGRANGEIAAELGCAVRTVEMHVTELLRKTATPSRTALIALLIRGLGDGK
jgi:DNA-binding NarL/FixJ family response regulator